MRTLKKTLCLVLAVVMVLGMGAFSVSAADNFAKYPDGTNVDGTYKEAVDLLIGLGIVEGMDDGNLALDAHYTRAQAAKITAYMVMGRDAAESLKCIEAPFTDIPADNWAAGYISYCANNDILDGMGDGTFNPTGELTGYAFAKMLLCAVGYGKNDEYVGSAWEINVSRDAVRKEIFAGDLSACVNAPITRQQAMLMAFNALTKVAVVKYSTLINDYVDIDASNTNIVTGMSVDKSHLLESYDSSVHKATGVVQYTTANKYYYVTDTPSTSKTIYNIGLTVPYDMVGRTVKVWYKERGANNKPEAITDYYTTDTLLAESYDGTSYANLTTAGKSTQKVTLDSKTQVYCNGSTANSLDINDVARRGVKVSFYDSNNNGQADVAVIIKKSTTELTAAPAVTKDGKKVNIATSTNAFPGQQDVANFDVDLANLAKGDIILYVKDAANVYHIEKATSKVDRLVRYNNSAASALVLDTKYDSYNATNAGNHKITLTSNSGESYKLSEIYGVGETLAKSIVNENLGVDANYFSDGYGYIVNFKVVTPVSKNYALLIDYYTNGGTNYGHSTGYYAPVYAQLLKDDGTVLKAQLKNVTFKGTTYYSIGYDTEGMLSYSIAADTKARSSVSFKTSANGLYQNVNHFFSYSEDGDSYNLTYVNNEVFDEDSADGAVKNTKATIEVKSGNKTVTYYGNNDTVYLYQYQGKWLVAKGVNNAPINTKETGISVLGANAESTNKGGTASVVVLQEATAASTGNTYFFVEATPFSRIVNDSTTEVNEKGAIYKVIKNGELQDLILAGGPSSTVDKAGFYEVTVGVTGYPEGYARVDSATKSSTTLTINPTHGTSVDKNGYFRTGNSAYTYTSDVKVYVVDLDDDYAFSAGGIELVEDDISDTVFVEYTSPSLQTQAKSIYILRNNAEKISLQMGNYANEDLNLLHVLVGSAAPYLFNNVKVKVDIFLNGEYLTALSTPANTTWDMESLKDAIVYSFDPPSTTSNVKVFTVTVTFTDTSTGATYVGSTTYEG